MKTLTQTPIDDISQLPEDYSLDKDDKIEDVEPIENTQRQRIIEMDPTLTNFKENLNKVFVYLENLLRSLDFNKSVLFIGNTGCGKTTMIASLIYGPDALEEKKIPKLVILRNGKKYTKQIKVIDYKD